MNMYVYCGALKFLLNETRLKFVTLSFFRKKSEQENERGLNRLVILSKIE